MNININIVKAANSMMGFAVFSIFFLFVITACAQLEELHKIQIQGTDGRSSTYYVEIALTEEDRAYGLMYRKEMPEGQGMIFLEPEMRPRVISMWMKNTYIPLDMIFINAQGIVSHIHEGAIPHDLTSISSIEPAIAVIELNAGEVQKHKISAGDKLLNYKKLWEVKKSLE
jgi:hypothetical protein